jgi:hypothetical protein
VYPVSPSWTVRPDCLRDGFGSSFTRRGNDDDEKTQYLEAGKKRLAGDTAREATSNEVKQLPTEATALKETLAELLTENRVLKRSVTGGGEDDIRDIRPQRSMKLSAWSRNPVYLSVKHSDNWIFTNLLSTTG